MSTATANGTANHIVERNRQNSRLSTGPRTAEGKAVSRGNALKHGLTANPAAGVIEEPEQFDQLHSELIECIEPRNIIEERQVHRIAVALWRQHRAAVIDAGISGIAIDSVVPHREQGQYYIRRINHAWEVVSKRTVNEYDSKRLRKVNCNPKEKVYDRTWERPALHSLDAWREMSLMDDGAAITAMMIMLQELYWRLKQDRCRFRDMHAEQLAWLLGEDVERYPLDLDRARSPHKKEWASPIDELIGEARERESDTPIDTELESLVLQTLSTYDQQRRLCGKPYTDRDSENHKKASLLPNAAMLDRLIRYETHADRTLSRAIEMLARLRGQSVQSFTAIAFAAVATSI